MPLLARRTSDLAPAVPCLGRWASLRFALDPDRFLAEGRALAYGSRTGPLLAELWGQQPRPWAFHLDGHRVLVVGSREAADAVLKGPTRFYRGDVLAPLLGRASPLLDLVPQEPAPAEAGDPYRAEAREHLDRALERLRQPDPDEIERIIEAEVYPFGRLSGLWREEIDIATRLHRAAVRVALLALRAAPFNLAVSREVAQAAEALLDAADTLALVVPALRRWSPRWRRLAEAREAFLRAVGLGLGGYLGYNGDGYLGYMGDVLCYRKEASEEARDRAVTTLVGAVDAPVALALDALSRPTPPILAEDLDEAEAREPGGARALFARKRVDAALQRRGPIPLLLREVVEPLEVPGLGLLQPGAAVAVDATSAGYPFGAGAHACVGARLGRAFAEAAVRVCFELGLKVVRPAGRRVRRRLVAALPALWMRATGTGRLRVD